MTLTWKISWSNSKALFLALLFKYFLYLRVVDWFFFLVFLVLGLSKVTKGIFRRSTSSITIRWIYIATKLS